MNGQCRGWQWGLDDKGREGLEKGLEVLYWGLEWRLRRFLDVYVLDEEKPLLRGLAVIICIAWLEIRLQGNQR